MAIHMMVGEDSGKTNTIVSTCKFVQTVLHSRMIPEFVARFVSRLAVCADPYIFVRFSIRSAAYAAYILVLKTEVYEPSGVI